MDYKEQAVLNKSLAAEWNKSSYIAKIGGMKPEEFLSLNATAITDLLARAEAAEEDRDRMREAMKPNCLLCDSMHENGNCTEVGGFCTAVPAAHCPLIPRLRNKLAAVEARAENAEAQLRVAVGALVGQCKYCRKNQECTSRKGPHIYCWEWRGQKEE